MQTLTKIEDNELPFEWIDLTDLRKSNCLRKEIYLNDKGNPIEELKAFFYSCFGNHKESIVISNGLWSYFCLDTWNPDNDTYDLSGKGSSTETKRYLKMLQDSKIDTKYEGLCTCNDWDNFLSVILPPVVNHSAPYSPYFFDRKNEYMFYFRHTNSIGLYYKTENKAIQEIFSTATALNCSVTE